jgi:hypothetical protein
MSKPKRGGPAMTRAAQYVARHPGCAILPAAEYVGPNGSRYYGYRIVHLAIKAGLIRAERDSKRNRYFLYPVPEAQS